MLNCTVWVVEVVPSRRNKLDGETTCAIISNSRTDSLDTHTVSHNRNAEQRECDSNMFRFVVDATSSSPSSSSSRSSFRDQ